MNYDFFTFINKSRDDYDHIIWVKEYFAVTWYMSLLLDGPSKRILFLIELDSYYI